MSRTRLPLDTQLSLPGVADAGPKATVAQRQPSSTDPPPHKGDSAAPPERDMNHRDHSTQSDEKDRTRHRRPRGTGAVFKKSDRWYGQWYVRGRLVKRSLGPVRPAGTRDGLTKAQA